MTHILYFLNVFGTARADSGKTDIVMMASDE